MKPLISQETLVAGRQNSAISEEKIFTMISMRLRQNKHRLLWMVDGGGLCQDFGYIVCQDFARVCTQRGGTEDQSAQHELPAIARFASRSERSDR